MKRLTAAALVLAAACTTSSDVIRSTDTGFSVETTEESAFTARYESGRPLDAEEMTRNFLFHAAKAVIDRGGVFMRVDGISTEASTSVDRHDTVTEPGVPESVPASPTVPQPGATRPPTEPTYRSLLTIDRDNTARGYVRYWKRKPADIITLEATEVMERARSGNVTRF